MSNIIKFVIGVFLLFGIASSAWHSYVAVSHEQWDKALFFLVLLALGLEWGTRQVKS